MLKTSLKKAITCFDYGEECKNLRQSSPAMSMEQQMISLRIAAELLHYAREGNAGRVLQAPGGVILSREMIQPDVLFVARNRRGIIGKTRLYAGPDLIVDVLSVRAQEKEVRAKKKLYAFFEVKEYWIADPDSATIEVLAWSELGYLSIGKYGKADRLSSPLLAGLNLHPSKVFTPEDD